MIDDQIQASSKLYRVLQDIVKSGRDKPIDVASIKAAAREDNMSALVLANKNIELIQYFTTLISDASGLTLSDGFRFEITSKLSDLRQNTDRQIRLLKGISGS